MDLCSFKKNVCAVLEMTYIYLNTSKFLSLGCNYLYHQQPSIYCQRLYLLNLGATLVDMVVVTKFVETRR